jgi:hypothetical protein
MKSFFFVFLLVNFAFADEIPFSELKKTLTGQGDVLRKTFKRLGDKTISFESMASLEGDFKKTPKILTDVKNWGTWALQNINVGPEGKNYFLQINGIDWKKELADQIGIIFSIKLPIFKHEGTRRFVVSHRTEPNHVHIGVTAPVEPQSVIESCEGSLDVYPAEKEADRLWIGLKGTIKLRNWILYEALPEKLISNEAGERIQTVLINYQKEELRANP